ncbi:NADH-quinone oxidoreductase subunit J [Klenkia sp. LSe6-5]|uniref:NADH-quinone oxidoreductase subunit J n=1 Tax=Klenkia sesuvii TaxID=3103137 RepID=A0ABU8DUR0_9ACTN
MSVLSGIVFWVLGALAVGTGVAVFRVDSMARASYALAVSFAAVGLALLLVDLEFVGVVTVLMMTMEMAVMAVFMVMFMGMNPALMPMSMTHGTRTPAVLAVGCFLLLGSGSVLVPWPTREGSPAADPTASLGLALMESKMLVMLTVSAVLFATVVAALCLAAARTRYDRFGDDLRSRPVDPIRGGVGR